MAIPPMTEVPTYVVYRDTPPGETFDPSSPLLFFPPKGSDELFDALRMAFPLVKSHSERMREAVIAFLLEERQDDRSHQPSPAMTMDTMPTTWPSMSSGSTSLLSSPETLNFATPASSTISPAPLTRQASTATSSQPSPPSLDAMTGVFSLSTSVQPRQRVRRKMTEAEKIEYRKRRIVKACDKCAKRKRKCPHNQTEMETVPSNKFGAKVTKSVLKSSKSAPPVAQQLAWIDDSFSVDEFNFDPATFGPWEDFNMFEDPMAEVNIEEFVNFDQQQYGSKLFTPDVSPLQPHHDDATLLFPSLPATGDFDLVTTVDRTTPEDRIHNGGRGGHGGSIGGSESPDLLYASSDERFSAGGYARQGDLLKNQQFLQNEGEIHGDGMIWEHLRTGQPEQPVPTQTAHVHNVECGGLSALDGNIGGPQQTRRPPTLPQTVLRLTGTAKAVGASASTSSRKSALDSVSLRQASLAVSALHHSSADLTDKATYRRSRPSSGTFDGAAYLESNLREAAEARTPARLEPQRLEENHALDERRETHAQVDGRNVAANPRANFNAKQSQILQSRALIGGIGRGGIEPTLTSTSVSVSDRSHRSERSEGRPEQVVSPAGRRAASLTAKTPQCLTVPSLGEGLPPSADSSAELYMARKRVTSNLHRLVERNASAPLSSRPTAHTASPGQGSLESAVSSSETGYKFKNGPSSSANGGAYLRLQETEASPSTTTTLKPIRTHTSDPTMYDFNGAVDQHHNSETPTVAQAQAGPATTFKKSAAVNNASVASTVHEERLSDHFRYRDHHGRTDEHSYPHGVNDRHDVRIAGANHDFVDHAQDVATIYRLCNPGPSHAGEGEGSESKAARCIAILAGILLLTATLSAAPLSSTVLMLALVYPLQISEGKESPVHCTTENIPRLKSLLPNKGFSAHKLAKAKCAGTANGVWLRGLMYPHEMAPLQTVRA